MRPLTPGAEVATRAWHVTRLSLTLDHSLTEGRHLPEGTRVVVHVGGKTRHGLLISYVEARGGFDAEVRLDGDTATTPVPAFTIRPEPVVEPQREPPERWWWPRSLPLRITVFTLLLTALAVPPGWLALALSSDDSRIAGDAAAPPQSIAVGGTTTPTTNSFALASSLVAFNRSWGRKWGHTIAGDATDRLVFRLEVENRSPTATPELNLQVLVM